MVALLWSSGCILYVQVTPGSGVSAVEERTVGSFDRLENNGTVDVTVEIDPDDPGTITVTCDNNLLDLVRTRAVGDALIVDHPFGFGLQPTVPCSVVVRTSHIEAVENDGTSTIRASGDLRGLSVVSGSGTGATLVDGVVPDLIWVEASGTGDVQIDGIEAVAPFDVDASGVGQIRLSGTGSEVALRSSGVGGIDGRDLTVSVVTVNLSGVGDVWITATDTADIDVSGIGDVHLFGAPPDVSTSNSGLGDVIFEE